MAHFQRVLIALAGLLLFAAGALALGLYSTGMGSIDQTTPTGAVVWTKAVCDGNNYCVDFEVTCEDGRVIRMEPTPYSAKFSEEWKDPRSEEFRTLLC